MTALPNGRAKLWELWSCDAPRRTEKLAAYSLEELVAVNRELESPDFPSFACLKPMVAERIAAKLHAATLYCPTKAADASMPPDQGTFTIPIWLFGAATLSLLVALWMVLHR